MKTSKLQFKTSPVERYSYAVYFFGQLIFFMLVSNFLQLYMTDSGIPATLVGGIFITAKVWDAINDPLFGVVVDKTRFKGGKYLPWVRLSSFLIPLTTILLFSVPTGASVQIKAIWVTVAYMLWDTSYTICDVPIFALATSMTDELKERDWLLLVNRFFTFLGGILVVILVPMLYPNIGWTPTVIIMAVLAMATMLPVGYKAKERFFAAEEKSPRIRDLVHYLAKNKPLLIFSGALVISSLTSTGSVMSNYVAIHCLGGEEWITILALAAALPMLISILTVQQIIKKVDKFTIYLVCSLFNMVLGVVMYFAGYHNTTTLLLLTAVRSVFSSAGTVLLIMFVADCAEYGHFVTGERAQGMAFSIQTFTAKITMALSGAIGMFFLGAVGFIEGTGATQTPETIEWIWRLYTIVPLFSGSIAFLLILFGYKLRTRDVVVMMQVNKGELTKEAAQEKLSRSYN